MKEKIKTILIIVVTVTLSITGSVLANTILSADSVSYKTENGETTVDNALDRLFNIADLNIRYNDETDYIQLYSNNEWVDWRKAFLERTYLYNNGVVNTTMLSNGFSLLEYAGSSGSVNYKTSSVEITATATSTSIRYEGLYAKIDVTDIDIITMKYSATSKATGNGVDVSFIGASKDFVSNPYANNTASYAMSSISSTSPAIDDTLTLNVSNLTGEYYIYWLAIATNSSSTIVSNITEIYMQ